MLAGLHPPFTTMDDSGALIGPFPVMLRFPELAKMILEEGAADRDDEDENGDGE